MAKDHTDSLGGLLRQGGYVARVAAGAADIRAAQALRHACFVEAAGRPALPRGLEADRFDDVCTHVLIEDGQGRVKGTFRVQVFDGPAALKQSYSAQTYDLSALTGGPFLELGRFCVAQDVADSDVVRLAWGMLAQLVDRTGAQMLFGCSSFQGIDPAPYTQAFDLLAASHLCDRIGRIAPQVYEFAAQARPVRDRKAALAQLPSLLRTYLGMGGWVSDHAVIDSEMHTLHVFTGLRIADIPPARAAALRAVAASG